MTPYEEQQMRIAIMRQTGQAIPPGMMSQSAGGPSNIDKMEDTSGAQRSADAQRGYANMLRGKAAPKGKTVGPSGLYVGPNWGESLEYAVNQGLGGYMAGQANKKDEALDEKRSAQMRAVAQQKQDNSDRTFAQGDRRLDLSETGQGNQVSQFAQTLGQGQQRIDNQAGQFGQKFKQQGDQFDQTFGQNQQKIDELVYQAELAQGNKERDQQLKESDVTPYLIDGEVVNTQQTQIEGKMVHVDPDTGQPVNIQGGKPIPKKTDRSGAAYTPKSPREFYRNDGALQETVMVGTERINVGGPRDGEKFIRDGAREALEEGKLATELGKFEKRTEGTRQLAEKFNAANAVLEEYDIDIFSGDAPMGFLQQVPGFVGGAVRSMSDLAAADPQAAEKFSVINDVIAQLVREQAGLSQTAKEIETISNTYGRNWYDRPDVVAKAWPRLQKLIAADIASKTASTHGQVLNEYRLGLSDQGVGDWTRIGVGLDPEIPPSWIPSPDSPTGKVKSDVDRRGRAKPGSIEIPDMKILDAEEEELYKQYPNLRPK